MTMVWGGVGTGFTFLVLMPDSYVLTRYPTHTQRGRESEPPPHSRWVWVSPPHHRPSIQYNFFNKNISFFATPG